MTERTTQEEKWRPLAFRTALQRLTGLALLLIGLGGLWYWWEHPLPGGAAIRQTVLAGQAFCLPVGLWQILYCPRRRGPGEGELAVYNADWIAPISAAMELFVAVVLPMVPVLVATDSDLAALIVCDVFLMVGILAMAVVVMAARNEGLLVGPDGRVECWTIWGRHHWVEERPALLRVRPRLGRYYVCDEEGHVLYHFDRDMVNDTALLNLLQARGVANTSAGVRQKMTNPWPKVREVLDWDEADWTPAHRYLNWMRMVVWLPPAALLVQWWMLQEGLPLLGLRPASLIACWLPLVFFGGYLVWPQIFVWERYPTQPSSRYRGQILATPAWRRMHVSLGGTFLPAAGALLWAMAESRTFLVGRPVPLAVLCLALGTLLAVLCEKRRPREREQERWTILLLAALLAFPLGYSLNLALTGPAHPDTGTVVEVRLPEGDDNGSLVFQWEGRTFRTPLGGDPAPWPQPGEKIDLCVRESPLDIPVVSVCRD